MFYFQLFTEIMMSSDTNLQEAKVRAVLPLKIYSAVFNQISRVKVVKLMFCLCL